MSLERKATSRSRRRLSQTLHVSSEEAVTKKAPPRATATALTARRCSARCAMRTPRGAQCAADPGLPARPPQPPQRALDFFSDILTPGKHP